MGEERFRGYITDTGQVAITDPSFDLLPLIKAVNPGFQIRSEPPPSWYVPKIVETRRTRLSGLSLDDLCTLRDETLAELHDHALRASCPPGSDSDATLFDLKVELAARELAKCALCAWLCGVNRYEKPGRCGLKDDGFYTRIYTHISEERPVTPCVVVHLAGCALRCKGCQAFEALTVPNNAKKLGPSIWPEMRATGGFDKAVAVEFVGGSPDENLYAVLYSLQFAPTEFSLPIVWNCHSFATPVVYWILDGVVDVWLPDFKFGPGNCCEKVAGIKGYWDVATAGVEEMVKQDAKIIVRVLVMPGHIRCCHEPALKWLSSYRERIWLSLIEFVPHWRAVGDPQLGRCASVSEMRSVRELAADYGLRNVEESNGQFWLK